MKRSILLKLIALIVVAGVSGILFWHFCLKDEGVVPAQFRGAVTEKEVSEATVKFRGGSPAGPTTSVAIDSREPVRLAIGGLGLSDDSQNGQLADLVLADLSGAAGLELIDRQSVDRILQEQSLGLSGIMRASTAVRVGKLLHADWFLFATTTSGTGTNASVARLVDARTGVLVDVGVFPQRVGREEMAKALAGFVRDCRNNLSHPGSRVSLAFGALEDLSLNDRQANFPNEMRGYLTAAFRDRNVALLEREYVDALWQEVQLDLASLTEYHTNDGRQMVPAFWLVSGCYQSYENEGLQVEALLEVRKVAGLRGTNLTFRGKPGNELYDQVYRAISQRIQQDTNLFVFSLRTEVKEQIETGKDLMMGEAPPETRFSIVPRSWASVELHDRGFKGGTEKRVRQHNLQEAVRSFQAALMLAPTNREAKLCLAECLDDPLVDQKEEAREHFRALLDESMDDSWAQRAQMDLSWSFDGEFPTGRAPWYVQAAAKSTNPRAKEYLQERADELAGKRNRSNPPVSSGPMDAQTLATAKSNLFVNLRRPNYAIVDAMERFVKNFGTNKAAAADALIALLPEMQAELPEKKPEVLSGALSMQVTTNVPILAEFRETLAECARDSKRWPKYDYFWTDVHQSVLPWSFDHGCFELAEQIISHETRDMATNAVHLDDRGLLLGLEYYRYEQWEKALKIFETFSNRPVDFHSSVSFFLKGPSRLPSGLVLTERYTIACEKKLGRPHVRDARQFDLEAPVRELSQQGTFFADASGLWTADFGELRHVGFDSKREVRIPLPATNEVAFNCMMVDGENVWLGTAGNGLWRISKTGCEQFTVGDGLLMDSVRRLGRDGDTLWIGYAERQSGGLGAFSLASQHFKSFMPAFNTNAFRPELVIEPPDGPPRHPVEDLAVESSGDVLLLVAEKGLQRYRPGQNSWEMVPSSDGFRITSVAASEQHLARGAAIMQYVAFMEQRHGFGEIAEGASAFKVSQEKLGATKKASPNLRIDLEGMPDEGGVELCSTATGQWRTLRDANGIPSPPMAMVFDGNDLWLGGKGYVACIDAKEVKVKRFCYVPGAVSRLQVAGGWVWAHVDNQLYRGH